MNIPDSHLILRRSGTHEPLLTHVLVTLPSMKYPSLQKIITEDPSDLKKVVDVFNGASHVTIRQKYSASRNMHNIQRM